MNVLVIKFELSGIDAQAYRALTAQIAPKITQVPGLISKTWLADDTRNCYGGAYLFEDRESIEAYLRSDTVRQLKESGVFSNVTAEVFDTIEPATSMTSNRVLASA